MLPDLMKALTGLPQKPFDKMYHEGLQEGTDPLNDRPQK